MARIIPVTPTQTLIQLDLGDLAPLVGADPDTHEVVIEYSCDHDEGRQLSVMLSVRPPVNGREDLEPVQKLIIVPAGS